MFEMAVIPEFERKNVIEVRDMLRLFTPDLDLQLGLGLRSYLENMKHLIGKKDIGGC